MSEMYKIAVMGDYTSILGYRTLGFEVCEANTAEEGERELSRLSKENYAVVYVTEELASLMPSVIEKYKKLPLPAVILIPGKGGSLGLGMHAIHDAVERAVGSDILG